MRLLLYPYLAPIYNQRMRPALDRFILGVPLLFIKQFPYAWIALIALWTWPPIVPKASKRELSQSRDLVVQEEKLLRVPRAWRFTSQFLE